METPRMFRRKEEPVIFYNLMLLIALFILVCLLQVSNANAYIIMVCGSLG